MKGKTDEWSDNNGRNIKKTETDTYTGERERERIGVHCAGR